MLGIKWGAAPCIGLVALAATGCGGEEEGQVVFDGWHGSGDLVSMQRADAFAHVPKGEGEAAVGSEVDVFPLTRDVAW